MKLNKTLLFGLLSLLFAATACEDHDSASKTALGQPDPSEAATSVNSLTFKWDRVASATQYGYQLTDPEGEVVNTGVTREVETTITGLKPATTYTLTVWAYAAVNGNNTTSKIAVLTATTAATEQLAAPDGFEKYYYAGETTVTWDAVAHAGYYEYVCVSLTDTVTGVVYSPEVSFTGLKHVDYTLTVTAGSYKDEYTSSEAQFRFPVTANVLWTNTGTYKSLLLNAEYEAELVCYDDGVYELSKWYGASDSPFEFKVDDDGVIQPFGNYAETSKNVWMILTGNSELPYVEISTINGRQSIYDGTKDNGGIIKLNATGYTGVYETFSWDATVFELYSVNGTFTCGETGESYDATLTVYDNHTASLRPWVGVDGYNLDFAYNAEGAITDILNGEDYYGDGSLFWAYTGLDYPGYMYIVTENKRSYITGDRVSGSLVIYEGLNAYYTDTFTWSGSLSAASLVGTYSYVTTGQEYVSDFTNWYDFSYTGTYDVTLNADGKLVFDNFYWYGYPMEGTFDPDKMTITFQPQQMGYYTFADDESDTTPVVATVSADLSTITFEYWNGWYGGYCYFWDTKTVFTR